MKNKYVIIIIAFVAVLTILIACRHEILYPGNSGATGSSTGGVIPPATANCSSDSVYFINDIMPIISSNCTMSGCHDNITHAEGVNLTTYNNIIRYVKSGNAAESKLYNVIIRADGDGMPPPPMLPLSSAKKALIQKWINQGAKNNNCIGRCDTSIFSYSGAVKPLIDNKCVGCHNSTNLGGNVDLSTYNAVKIAALNGKLFGSVAQQSGYSPMPKNAAKLSDCEITQIQKWISAGSQNN